jgi:hypothetical protein
MLRRTIAAVAATAAVGFAAFGAPARAAEPELVLSTRLAGATAAGTLVRTGQGLALLGDEGLTPLEGGRPAISWAKRGYRTPVTPGRRWLLAVEKPRTGGYAEPQLRGRLMLGDLTAAEPLADKGTRTLHNAAWPVAASEGADGSLLMLLWAKAPPFVTTPGYRLVLLSPDGRLARTAEWPAGYPANAPGQMIPDGKGGWSLLTRMADPEACGGRAGVALLAIDADLKAGEARTVCLPRGFTPFTSEVLTGAQTERGTVWFVSGRDAGAHLLARIDETGGRLTARSAGQLPAGEVGSVVYDPASGDLVAVQGGGKTLARIGADGQVRNSDAPVAACDGRPAGGKRSATVAVIDGRLYLTAIAADGGGACVNVWRY